MTGPRGTKLGILITVMQEEETEEVKRTPVGGTTGVDVHMEIIANLNTDVPSVVSLDMGPIFAERQISFKRGKDEAEIFEIMTEIVIEIITIKTREDDKFHQYDLIIE